MVVSSLQQETDHLFKPLQGDFSTDFGIGYLSNGSEEVAEGIDFAGSFARSFSIDGCDDSQLDGV